MANMLSELERFEQEMKELGSEETAPPPPPPPPLQRPPYPSSSAQNPYHVPSRPPPPPLPPTRNPQASVYSYPPPPPRQNPNLPPTFQGSSRAGYGPYYGAPYQGTVPAPPYSTQYSTSGGMQAGPTMPAMHVQGMGGVRSMGAHGTMASDAEQLFQRDASHLTAEALHSVKLALANDGTPGGGGVGPPGGGPAGGEEVEGEAARKKRKKEQKAAQKAVLRKAAGQIWEDPTMIDWPENDHRLFCGDLGNEVNDEVLTKAFSRFASFNMARVIRDKRTGKTKGFGFVSFADPFDLAKAIKEMNGKYVGNRPVKLRKSSWKERADTEPEKRPKGWVQAKRHKRHIVQ